MPLQGEFVLNNESDTQPAATPQGKPGTASPPEPIPAPRPRVVPVRQKNKLGIFSNFTQFPEGLTFQNQEESEEVVLLVRKDFITNVPWIFIAALLLILPAFLPFIQSTFLSFIILSRQTAIIIAVFYYVAIFGYIFLSYATWYFQVGLVTNIRAVDVTVPNILNREVSETFLDLIKDVSYTQKGVFQSFFDFGDVVVQTAAPQTTIIYDSIPRPGTVTKIISDLVEGKNRE